VVTLWTERCDQIKRPLLLGVCQKFYYDHRNE
jgi:hypothetical protein